MDTPPPPIPGAELRYFCALRKSYSPSTLASNHGMSPPEAPQFLTRISSPLSGARVYQASSDPES